MSVNSNITSDAPPVRAEMQPQHHLGSRRRRRPKRRRDQRASRGTTRSRTSNESGEEKDGRRRSIPVGIKYISDDASSTAWCSDKSMEVYGERRGSESSGKTPQLLRQSRPIPASLGCCQAARGRLIVGAGARVWLVSTS